MSRVVAIDSSGAVTSIGVGGRAEQGFVARAEGGRKHAEVIDRLMRQVTEHLAGDRPDAIAVGVGPGPYSGLRVGIAFATGLGRAWRCPVVGVCSLDAIAWALVDTGVAPYEGASSEFVVTADARRSELYWARYDAAAMRIAGPQVAARDAAQFDVPVVGDQQVDPAAMAQRVAGYLEAGVTPQPIAGEWAPHGADGSVVKVPVGPLLEPRPLYLRAPDVTVSSKSAPTPATGIF